MRVLLFYSIKDRENKMMNHTNLITNQAKTIVQAHLDRLGKIIGKRSREWVCGMFFVLFLRQNGFFGDVAVRCVKMR